MKHCKRLSLCLAVLVSALWSVPALAQENLTSLKDSTFGDPMRTAVPFLHNAHNEKAKLTNCAACHHSYKNGQRVLRLASTDQKCSSCHAARPGPTDAAPALMTAYHKLCQDCHTTQNKGPVTCGKCHKK